MIDWETSSEAYLEHLCEALGHNDRESGLKGYCQGLMLPIRRKSVEPLAAHLEPEHVSARHQSLHHFDERMLDRLYARSQAFDLLTGGDPSADPDDESDYEIEGIDEPGRKSQFVALPEAMRRTLRADLRAIR